MWDQTLEVARYAVAWSRPMSEIVAMSSLDLAAMDTAYTELASKQKRAQRAADRKRH